MRDMQEVPNNMEGSVYSLLTSLCRNIGVQNGLDEFNGIEVVVPKLRAAAYEILLKKTSEIVNWNSVEGSEPFNALRALDEHLFVTKFHAKARGEDATELEESINLLVSNCDSYFETNKGNRTLEFLLALQNNIYDGEQELEIQHRKDLLVPGAFTLHAPFQNNRYYPKKIMNLSRNFEPKYFQSLQKMQENAQKGFLPQFFAKNVRKLLRAPIGNPPQSKSAVPNSDESDCTFTGMTRRHICSDADWLRIDMRSLQFKIQKSADFYALQMSAITCKPFQLLEKTCVPAIQAPTEIKEESSQEEITKPRCSLSWSWNQIGSKKGIQCPKPFVSDVNVPFQLYKLTCQERKKQFEAKVLSKEQFLKDLKLLTVGLQSDTFHHNKEIIFSMLPNITIENVLPLTMENYVREFLECGTCYKYLQVMTSKDDYKFNHGGFILKACRAAVSEFLLTFRQYVFSHKGEETLISYYKRMKRLMGLVQNLSLTLAQNPKVDPDARLPKGSQFLGYLYREIMHLTDNEYITLLMFLLKRCCHVYFRYLQLWIFHGILDDPSKELFILYVDHYRNNTKHFYDKAYVVRKETVPGFFQNYEDRILQCGKYTMLLKAYNSNHPLFDLEYPKVAVRPSFEEIQSLEASCAKYTEKAREVCGKPVTVKDIFEVRSKRRNDFQQMVFQRSRENMERWNLEQLEISKTIAEEKRKRLEVLTSQLEEAKQLRIEKRRESVEAELRALREAEILNEERLKRENINLRKRIEYYQELSNTLKADDSVSSASPKKTRRYSLASEGEVVTPKSLTSKGAPHSFSTTSLKKKVGSPNNDPSECRESIADSIKSQFQKTSYEISTYCEERNKEYDNNNYFADTISAKISEGKSSDNCLGPEMVNQKMQRSISDVINSNISQEDVISTPASDIDNLTPLQINRLRTLTGTMGLCFGDNLKSNMLLDNRNKKAETLRVTFGKDICPKRGISKALTELELNKQKVLTAGDALRLDNKSEIHRKSLPDINLNTMPENLDTQSDLERNRKRMMEGPGLFAKYVSPHSDSDKKSFNKPPLTDMEKNKRKVLREEYAVGIDQKKEGEFVSLPCIDINVLSDEKLTDLQKNRRRMMESPHPFAEYNKGPLSDRPKLNLNLNTDRARNRRKVLESEYNILTGDSVSNRDILTPMSTTSDPPITEQLSEISDQKSEKSDIVNGNLKLNIPTLSKAIESSTSEFDENSVEPSTAATQPPFTPFDALNSAGVRARTGGGFEFLQPQTTNHDETAFLNLTSDCDEVDDLIENLHYTSPYQWCQQLVENKFKCSTRSSVFRLNIDSPQKTNPSLKANTFQNFRIDSLSVITLTEFLQKSVVMPMNTHMEIVNGEVMRVLLQDLNLIDHFRSLRHYFFLMDGEFGSIICDGIIGRVESGELPIKVLSYQMLHMILDTALSYSMQKDSNAENLSFIVSDIPPKFELNSPNVLNVLSLSYRVQWPLNLILNPETLEQYGNIFKYLLKVRRISWVLEKCFELLRQAAKQHGKKLLRSPQYLRIQQIRHKFYHFVHTLQHHITATALQASWKLFKDELMHAKSLEDIYRLHTQYVKRIMFLCMLNRSSAEFNNAIENIFKISLKFYNNLKSREFLQRDNAKEFIHSRFKKIISEEEEFDKLIKYTIYLGNKIVRRGYQTEIGEFITLININKYYTSPNINDSSSKVSKANDAS